MADSEITDSMRPPPVTGAAKLPHFIKNNIGWTFNFVFAHLLWWLYGFTAVIDYGYTDWNMKSDGSIPSGPSGSGVVIISGCLVFVATVVWTSKLITYDPNKEEE